MQDLLQIMARLRDPDSGCPWDLQQTYASIVPHTLEEAYEVADAIEREHWDDLKEELGDLLLQVVFYARLAEEDQRFDFQEIVDVLKAKLIRRHPHVFGDQVATDGDAVAQTWERIKQQEKQGKPSAPVSVMDEVPMNFPALQRAQKIQKKAARLGFDWTELEPVFDKIDEEIQEIKAELTPEPDAQRVEQEVGDLLFAAVNLARHLGVDSETALRGANQRFADRFRHMESSVEQQGRNMNDYSLEALESLWVDAKRALSSTHET